MAPVSVYFDCVSQTCAWIGIIPRSWPGRITSSFRPFRRPRLLPWLFLLSATRAISGDGSHRCASNIGSIFRTGKTYRSEEHTSELQSHSDLVCRLLLEKKK